MSYEEIRFKFVQGRKEYLCEWCDEIIPKGEAQLHRVYKYEGDFNDARQHMECYKNGMRKMKPDELADGWMPGDFKRGTCEAR